jgi:hypothetical protein
MGFLSKAWKGLKKGVKKVARGIKKVVKKVGAAIGKLGIVGQIGMMFLMPYAMGALGSMFGTAGTLSGWSQTLLTHSNIASKALGHTLNLINNAGIAVGKVYNNVSSTISAALDKTGNFLKGRGFVATPTIDPSMAASAFSSGTSTVGLEPTTGSMFGADGKLIIDTGFNEAGLNTKLIDSTIGTPTNLVEAASADLVTSKAAISKTLSDVALSNTKNSSILGPVTKPKGKFLENINVFNKDSAIRQDIANFDAYDYGKKAVEGATTDAVIGGAKQALAQKTAEAFGYKQPEGADYYSFNMRDLMEASRGNPAVFDTVDFLASNSGNAYYGTALKNNPYITNLLSDNTSAYQSYMSQFQNQLMQPQG